MHRAQTPDPQAFDLAAARRQDEAAFVRLVSPHRAALQAHCYRMLGSVPDAEDALQEALLRAWRGLPGFEGRSSLRSWLYRIATNVCLRLIEQRPRRGTPADHGPPSRRPEVLDAPVAERVWIDPYPDEAIADDRASPEARYEQRESVELAFIAALQHLPARQRAALLLRDVLGFAPAEIADVLDTTAASVSSALQRAHVTVQERLPARSQQQTLRSLGDERVRELVERYVRAWEDSDVEAILGLLAADAAMAMPPYPTWFRGHADVGAFLRAWPLSRPGRWKVRPASANGQVALATYHVDDRDPGRFDAHSAEVLTVDAAGRITEITAFLDPAHVTRLGFPDAIAA